MVNCFKWALMIIYMSTSITAKVANTKWQKHLNLKVIYALPCPPQFYLTQTGLGDKMTKMDLMEEIRKTLTVWTHGVHQL